MTDTDAALATNTQANLEEAAKYYKRSPPRYGTGITEEQVEPLVKSHIMKIPDTNERQRVANLTSRLVPAGTDSPGASIIQDPSRENLSFSRYAAKNVFKNPKQDIYIREKLQTAPMKAGIELEDKLYSIVERAQHPSSNWEPDPSLKTPKKLSQGGLAFLYKSNDDDPETHSQSNFLRWLDDNEVIDKERYTRAEGLPSDFGLQNKNSVEGVPHKIGFAGKFDILSVGRKGTALEGKTVMTDIKGSDVDITDYNSMNNSINKHITDYYLQALMYKDLFGKDKEYLKKFRPPDYFALLFPKSGYWAIMPNRILEDRAPLKKFFQEEYNIQATLKSIPQLTKEYYNVTESWLRKHK